MNGLLPFPLAFAAAFLEHQSFQRHLSRDNAQLPLVLDGVRAHKTVHHDRLCLSDAVGPVHGLHVVVWVEVAVKQDDGVGGSEIQSSSTGARADEEKKKLRRRR